MRTRSQSRDDPLGISSPVGLFASRRSEPSLASRSAVPPSIPSATVSSAAPPFLRRRRSPKQPRQTRRRRRQGWRFRMFGFGRKTDSDSRLEGETLPAIFDDSLRAGAGDGTNFTDDSVNVALQAFVQSVVSEVVPDRAGGLSSNPFRLEALPSAGEGVSWR